MVNFLKGCWRLFQPTKNFIFRYPVQLPFGYIKYFQDLYRYKKAGGKVHFRYLAPFLRLKSFDDQSGGGHYFFQDIWALKKLAQLKAEIHYDVGSRFDGFVGQATAICTVTCIDIRKPSFELEGLNFMQGSILQLPFPDNSINSLSCLHTIEHIGLGRYGDEIDPQGFNKGILELQRVMAKGGMLLLSMPVGLERTEFNAQRILNPNTPVKILKEMDLVEFSVVDDNGNYHTNQKTDAYVEAKYCCGLYHFVKK